jgi:hypothetical protein
MRTPNLEMEKRVKLAREMADIENLAKLVKDLESGKEKQGTRALHMRDGRDEGENFYCCLGRGCVVAGIEPRDVGVRVIVYEGETGIFPTSAAQFYGMPFPDIPLLDPETGEFAWASAMNDRGCSFEEIARAIRHTYLDNAVQ